ncbi:hypothetical protein AtEden1_Chr5g0115981 [Arabidopsis thaliana]
MRTPNKNASSKDPSKRDGDRKRNQPEDDTRSSVRTSRARTEEKSAGASKQKGKRKKGSHDLVVLSSRESKTRNSECRNTTPPPAPPMSFADTIRTFVAPGSAIAPFEEMKEVNRENYLRFAGKLGKLILEFNSTFYSHEDQLSDKESELDSFMRNEEKKAGMVERANKVMNRMKAAELRVQSLEVTNIDLTAKLESGKNAYLAAVENENKAKSELKACKERLKRIEEEQTAIIAAIRKEERRKLLEEIEKGEIPDISKELEVVRADEVKFTKKAAEPKPPRPNPIELTRLLADTPPEAVANIVVPDEALVIDEQGSNKNFVSESGIAAMFLVDVEKVLCNPPFLLFYFAATEALST